MFAILVAGRSNFDHSDDLAERMTDGDPIRPSGVWVSLCLVDETRPRGSGDNGRTIGMLRLSGGPGLALQGDHIGNRPATGALLGKGEVARRQTSRVQTSRQGGDPVQMEVVEDSGVDTSPIVNRHTFNL